VADDDTWADVFSRSSWRRWSRTWATARDDPLRIPDVGGGAGAAEAGDPRVAERFELYACGVELANCFGELTDPAEQRRRFKLEMEEKQRLYGERYPIDEDFLAALAQMPPASGGRSASTGW
jgi:lysyl-tRNA synthetase class 2